jgi:endonuclease/exonuclease/phosphatase family metal-dependent hydrolase
VRAYDPDLMGTQELFYSQGEYIREKLPEYAWFGISRRGNREDEHMGVFYKASKLRLVNSGNFWLSETPEKPGSMSWDVSLPRMVTWGLFETKAGKRRFYYYNTHFPHRREDAAARLKCAQVIVERAGRLPKNIPFILTGDFNAQPDGDAHQLFAKDWQDAWKTAPVRFGPEGTSSGFAGSMTGRRIDWIFLRGAVKALQTSSVTLNDKGRFPSDHFPVFTVLQIE